jgi:hypothetical protein
MYIVLIVLFVLCVYHFVNANRQLRGQEIRFEGVFFILLPFHLLVVYGLFNQLWIAFAEPVNKLKISYIFVSALITFLAAYDTCIFAMRRTSSGPDNKI